jgi:hypothetical protein
MRKESYGKKRLQVEKGNYAASFWANALRRGQALRRASAEAKCLFKEK